MTTIATQGLLLRPLVSSDVDALVRGLNNLNVSRWTARIPFPYGPKDAEDYIALCRAEEAGKLRLLITRDGETIGGIGIEKGEIGYWLAEPAWGKGYATEAARAVADHAFTAMDVDGLVASYALGNTASRRILLGLGFRETHEDAGFCKATNSENRIMRLQLTKDDWRQAKERRR